MVILTICEVFVGSPTRARKFPDILIERWALIRIRGCCEPGRLGTARAPFPHRSDSVFGTINPNQQ